MNNKNPSNFFWDRLEEQLKEFHSSDEYKKLTLYEQMDGDTFCYLVEVMDLNNVYSYKTEGNFYASFEDDNNIRHFIRIVYHPLSIPRNDVKL